MGRGGWQEETEERRPSLQDYVWDTVCLVYAQSGCLFCTEPIKIQVFRQTYGLGTPVAGTCYHPE
uniref:Uncharacterized protein n=1 Tax=Oncorhynchus tshawytscha TaxID=74940 RepID=A0AAZ3PD64_ONCTS